MADISMCASDACPSAKACYRHEAVATPGWQSFMDFRPGESGRCDSFLPIHATPPARRIPTPIADDGTTRRES